VKLYIKQKEVINMRKIYISPSLLSANFANLEKDIKLVESLGAEYLHFDVMDGHFVDNISFGIPVLKSIYNIHNMINDVHIMISNPKKYAKAFLEAGADILTFHLEAISSIEELHEIIDIIHSFNKKAGLSIKPNTPVESLLPFLEKLDLVLIMSVEPGFGGQEFNPSALEKIEFLRKVIDENNYSTLIEVDGGINEVTASLCKEKGVDILVAGSYLFNKEDIKSRIEALRK
jgi:ribulose-phosphate 3-epimerase